MSLCALSCNVRLLQSQNDQWVDSPCRSSFVLHLVASIGRCRNLYQSVSKLCPVPLHSVIVQWFHCGLQHHFALRHHPMNLNCPLSFSCPSSPASGCQGCFSESMLSSRSVEEAAQPAPMIKCFLCSSEICDHVLCVTAGIVKNIVRTFSNSSKPVFRVRSTPVDTIRSPFS